MKPLMLLFWIFAVPVHTIVLQPSVNVTVMQNVSAEGDLWAERKLDRLMEALNTEEEKRSEEEVTMQEAEEETDTGEEHGMKKTKRVKQTRGTDVKSKEVVEKEEQQEQNVDEHDMSDVILTKPILTAQNTSHSQEIEGDLPPTVNQKATPPTMATASQPVLNLHTKSVTVPSSFPSTSQGPATTTETLPIITTKLHTVNSTAEATGATLLVNESSTNDDLRVELHVMNSSKLHPLEEVSVDAAAMAARAGPTAKAPTFIVKSKHKPKDNMTLKAKKKKVLKVKAKKTKVPKKAKKVKKFKRERKLKPTTPSYFPYFEDHYCPSECSCYGRVVQCSDKHLDKIPYGIPYNSRYILLMNNHINSIQLKLLSEYDSMEFLVLSNNHLTDETIEGSFDGIKSLKRLYIERNLLQSIPNDLPVTLEELRLDGNQVNAMSNTAFGRCPNLLILSLSNNSLGNKSSTIPPGVLLPLGKLRTLTLSYNQLASVPLQLPISLRELYLRGNRIERLQGDMFWGEAELQVLDLSVNRLTDKGLGKAALLNASRLESLNLEGNLLKQVPLHLPRSIKTLNLERNFISSIGKDAFISMPQLEHLGLARNKITKVALGAFRVLPLLHQLDMSHNALQQVPRQLPLWLHSATFSHNEIRVIPRDAFCWGQGNESPLSRLVRVHLEYNFIDLGNLDTLAFRCLRGFQVVQFY
ncbi:wu:fc23c09 [Onychostoma macrolepis]|uniref:wu:fc23c09 n=1 Tax=Onychostoma macrolepis TaxID=369639 RepID=UPI00272B11C0|nr:wu:fc23c09 [Onychostoma macrolepis]XP_058629231.1 wu:fc23c09 [Onychostoma macrolepis]XP_058629232.1 wu:fc23c09 [Onychostoma macrolepis]XP_058629233.1 wu:fc23c09 [Onychostoma macrolepis]XP_058629234.1 wu:fc23c09 [Onychostoma macrolepis]XP_058629235.1 wu:fc23c09 [Onychostoma macrolepis]